MELRDVRILRVFHRENAKNVEKFGIWRIGKEEDGLWKSRKGGLKNVWKMGLCFLEKSVKLKSVDEHPHKQVKQNENKHLLRAKTTTKIVI